MNQTPSFLGTGFSFPPAVDPVTGKFKMCSGDEDIKQSVYIILMTYKNERAMLPEFGSGLRNYVFDLPDASSIALLRNSLQDALIQWEPRIIDVEVHVDATKIIDGKVILDISYTVRATNNPGNLVLPYYLYEGVGSE